MKTIFSHIAAIFLLLGSCFAASAGTVVAWGSLYRSELLPTNLTGIVNVASGTEHCLALRTNGTAIGWGWDYFGQATVPDWYYNSGAYPVNGPISNIAAGSWHSLALLQDGRVASWGDNGGYQTLVPYGLNSVVAVAGGENNSLALKSDGTVLAWGCGGNCVVPGDLTNIVAIEAGQYFSLALRGNGTVEAWGYNMYGECDVPQGLSNVVSVVGGNYHVAALKADGTVAVWGMATYGQTNVPENATNIVALAAGYAHTLALRADGSIVTWGWNISGQCNVPAGLSNAVAVSGGNSHSLALVSDGKPQFLYGRPGISVLPKKNFIGGESVLLHASAVGASPLAYLWNQDGTNIAVTTSPTLSLTNLLGTQSGQYTVIASNALGYVQSAPVTLTIDPMIYFTNQPANSTVYEAANARFSVTVGGYEPFNYQWRFNGADLPGETNAALALTQVSTNQAGVYSVRVTNPYGSQTSADATLTVQLAAILTQPTNLTVFGGEAATFKVSANGAALSYQWLFNGTNLPGATSNVLNLSLLTTNGAGVYCAQVSNTYRTLISSNATLAVVPLTAAVSPASQDFFVGDTATFSAVAQKNGPFTYQWRYNGADLPQQTNSTLTKTGLTTDQAGSYSVRVTNPYGVIESAGAALMVTDSAPTTLSGLYNRLTWIGDTISFPVTANGSKPLRYQWSYGTVPIPNATNASLTLSAVGTNQAGIYTVTVSNALGAMSASATLTLEPVVGWGLSSSGQTWVNLPPLTNTVAVSAGYNHNLALKTDGTVFSWGAFSTLPAANSNFTAVAAGFSQSLGLRSDGTVVAWGSGIVPVAPANLTNAAAIHVAKTYNSYQMNCFAIHSNSTLVGWNNSSYISTITNIPAGLTGVIGVAAGNNHVMALKSDGSITAWQDYSDYGANAPKENLTNTVAVAAGLSHSLALKANGTVVAWGYNTYGQTNVPAGLTNVVVISAGSYHSLALKSDGTVVAWGQNTYGQTNVPAAYTNIIALSGGNGHSIAMLGGGDLSIVRQPQSTTALINQPLLLSVGVTSKTPVSYQWRWNDSDIPGATNSWYRLAVLSKVNRGSYYVVVSNLTGVVTSSVAQVNLTGNAVLAWGLNSNGQTNVPAGLNAIAIGAGNTHSLALRADGTVAAWGGSTYTILTNVPANATNIIAISAGAMHNMVLTKSRKVINWGQSTPPANFTNFLDISSGNNYSLGLSNGTVAVWGSLPNPPSSLSNAIAIFAGYSQALALLPDGSLITWPNAAETPPNLSNVVTLASGNGFNLAVKTDGTVTAWGANRYGQCNVPAGLSNVVAVAAGSDHSLALKSDGTAVGWGNNYYGQTNIPNNASNIVAIAAGANHSLAIISSFDPAFVRQPAPLYTNITGRILLSVAAVSTQPLNYQWLTNGVPIAGATNWWLDLPKPQIKNSGSYSVIVSNALGVLTSSNTVVSVISRPPSFLTQPVGQTNLGGASIILSATVDGSGPLGYQWHQGEEAIFGATNLNLTIDNLTRSNGGIYSIIVSNEFGIARSSNAVVRVLVKQQMHAPIINPDGSVVLGFSDSDGGLLSSNDAPHFAIRASTNLVDWLLLSNTPSFTNGMLWIQDGDTTNFPLRFYRVFESP